MGKSGNRSRELYKSFVSLIFVWHYILFGALALISAFVLIFPSRLFFVQLMLASRKKLVTTRCLFSLCPLPGIRSGYHPRWFNMRFLARPKMEFLSLDLSFDSTLNCLHTFYANFKHDKWMSMVCCSSIVPFFLSLLLSGN